MRISLFIIGFFCYSITSITASAKPEIYLDHALFLDAEKNTQVEVQFKVPSYSVLFKPNENAKYQASLLINISLSSNNIEIASESYELLSEEVDEKHEVFSIIDIKKYILSDIKLTEESTFDIQVSISDQNSGKENSIYKSFNAKKLAAPAFSSIILLEKYYTTEQANYYSKGTFIPIPRINNIIDKNSNTLPVYFELYSNNKSNSLKTTFSLINSKNETVETKNISALQKTDFTYRFMELIDPKILDPDKYNLIIKAELNNKIIASKQLAFEIIKVRNLDHFGQLYSPNDIKLFAEMMQPILTPNESQQLDIMIATQDSNKIQKAFFEIWKARNAEKPLEEWQLYLKNVQFVNSKFGSALKAGYKTTRGRIFLEFGPPADINDYSDNPETYPYEIWHYYDDGKMGNSIFVFASFSFNKNDYQLIHSTALGQLHNPEWKKLISRSGKGEPNKKGWGTGWQTEQTNE